MSVHFFSFLTGVLCCTEQDVPIPTVPIIFNKLPSCIVRDGANIVKPSMTKKLDFEVELVIVIGKVRPSALCPRQQKLSQFTCGHADMPQCCQGRCHGLCCRVHSSS